MVEVSKLHPGQPFCSAWTVSYQHGIFCQDCSWLDFSCFHISLSQPSACNVCMWNTNNLKITYSGPTVWHLVKQSLNFQTLSVSFILPCLEEQDILINGWVHDSSNNCVFFRAQLPLVNVRSFECQRAERYWKASKGFQFGIYLKLQVMFTLHLSFHI